MALALTMAGTGAPPSAAQIVAPAGRTLFNEGVLVRNLVRIDSFDEPSGSGDLRRLRNIFAVVWGARPHLSLSLVTPVTRVESTAPAGGPDTRTTGTGDASIFARYDLLRRTVPSGYTRLAPEVGVKLPTGGAFGTGSTDVSGGLVFSHIRDPDWWIADVQWTLPGSGDNSIRLGERRRFDLAYLRRVFPRDGVGVPMSLFVVELNAESTGRSERGGATLPNTGGDVIFLSPGFEYVANRRLVLEASVPFAIHTDLSGSQPEPAVSLILGVRWLF